MNARAPFLALICLAAGLGYGRLHAADAAPVVAPPANESTHAPAPASVGAGAPSVSTVATAAHTDGVLRPIAETVQGLDLRALDALPVQHGGRYKPIHAFAMEVLDGITSQISFAGIADAQSSYDYRGHTPLTSLLDLLFCRTAYNDQPIVVVKHAELLHDLALVMSAPDRERLARLGRLTPSQVVDEKIQTALDTLGRQTAKTKAINQVQGARDLLDPGRLLFALKLFPLPAGLHDRWYDTAEVGPGFAQALTDYVRLARAAKGDLDAYGQQTWSLLPLSPETAAHLGLKEDETRQLNLTTLWQLWKAAGSGTIDDALVADLATSPLTAVARLGLDADDANAVVSGLTQLRQRWTKLAIEDTELAEPGERAAVDAALAAGSRAWNDLGAAWAAARRPGAPTTGLQPAVDAFVAAQGVMRALLDRDLVARGKPALGVDTALEMRYWQLGGFSFVAWLFLFAVPFLALGAIGRIGWALALGYALALSGFVGQIAAFVIRWDLAQRVPLSNLYESMAAASLLCSLVALIGELGIGMGARRSRNRYNAIHAGQPALAAGSDVLAPLPASGARGALALGAALFGCIIVLAQVFLERHDINAFISPAMPILSEFWLRVHTACVVSSYGIIALGGLMSVAYLLMRLGLRWDDPRSIAWDRATFAINSLAMVILWIGLSLGAVWAAESWGRPWGWDPKEVFALLTWVVFVILIHLRLVVRPANRGAATAWVSLAAMLVMVFNWYWVNVRLAGLHSYA